MQQNTTPFINQGLPCNNPNAVNINIIAPTAYGNGAYGAAAASSAGYNPNLAQNHQGQNQYLQNQYYYNTPSGAFYSQNPNANGQTYPANYNNLMAQPTEMLDSNINNKMNTTEKKENIEHKEVTSESAETSENKKEDKKAENSKKVIVPLTDDYIKSLENYLNDDNPKIRLIGVQTLLERFKENPERKDNPSLMPLLNKALKDNSPSVRFLALTILRLGYSVGNSETVEILKQVQQTNNDEIGEDAILASEILLNMSAPEAIEGGAK